MLNGDELILGPFSGKPACLRISIGKGVCGSAAQSRKTLIVDDVHAFPGHIACDPSSNSEIVIPLVKNGKLFGVLDIDSPYRSRFTTVDKEYLEQFVRLLLDESDMIALSKYYKN